MRRHFSLILSGPRKSEIQKIVIQIHRVDFRVIVAQHESHINSYNANVDQFLRRETAEDEFPFSAFSALKIHSTLSTAQPTGAHTPIPQTPIYINQEMIGSGTFSMVHRTWDVTTGLLYASKDIRSTDPSEFTKEAYILSKVSQLSNVS